MHKVEFFFIKLNSKSKRIFRFEVFNGIKFDINIILSSLMENSIDPIFIGYPYGLIDADKFARIGNKERDYYRTMIMVRLGKKWNDIEKFISVLDAHEVLDRLS